MRVEIGPFLHLYEEGGFYDDVDLLTPSSTQAQSLDVSRLSSVFPMCQYGKADYAIYSDSDAFSQVLREVFEAVRASYTKLPESEAFQVRQGYVRDAVLYVNGESGWGVLYPTYRANDRPSVSLIESAYSGGEPIETVNATGRTIVYFSSAGSFNYGHWLVDDLPRLRHVLTSMADPVTLIVQSYPSMDHIRRQTIDLLCLGRDVDICFVDPLKLLRFDGIVYVSPVSYHPFLKNPAALQYVRTTAFAALGLESRKREKIYVQRQRHRGRVLRNEALIIAYLATRGFRIVDPEALSFEEQIRAFSDADVIVGVMCATLCNVIFSRSNAILVVLAPNDWVEPFYWDLASVLGYKYLAIHGRREHVSPHPHLDDFRINFNLLRRVIDDVLINN